MAPPLASGGAPGRDDAWEGAAAPGGGDGDGAGEADVADGVTGGIHRLGSISSGGGLRPPGASSVAPNGTPDRRIGDEISVVSGGVGLPAGTQVPEPVPVVPPPPSGIPTGPTGVVDPIAKGEVMPSGELVPPTWARTGVE